MRRTWTLQELREAAEHYSKGETWDQVGARWEVSGSCVRTLIRRYRVPIPERIPKCLRTAPCARTQLLYRAIAIRNTEGLSWSIVAERVGWEKSAQALYAAVK